MNKSWVLSATMKDESNVVEWIQVVSSDEIQSRTRSSTLHVATASDELSWGYALIESTLNNPSVESDSK